MANSTVLAIVQMFCREYGLAVPTALQGSSDAGALQFRGILQNVGNDVRSKTHWQQCSQRASWSSVAGAIQGSIDILFPKSFSHVMKNTFWNESKRFPMIGPLTDAEWQSRKSLASTGPSYSFRFASNLLEVHPALPVGQVLSLIYQSRAWITSGNSVTTTFLTDQDVSLFADELMLAGLRAFWLRIKQMPHRLELDKYEELKANEAGRNTLMPTLHQDNDGLSHRAGIIVPIGNWTFP